MDQMARKIVGEEARSVSASAVFFPLKFPWGKAQGEPAAASAALGQQGQRKCSLLGPWGFPWSQPQAALPTPLLLTGQLETHPRPLSFLPPPLYTRHGPQTHNVQGRGSRSGGARTCVCYGWAWPKTCC